jgi:hypothetical protein
MNNVDGTTNQTGLIQHYYDFKLQMGDHEAIQRFYIGGIRTDRFILGFPWLQEFNPNINWTKKKHLGPPLTISTTTRTLGEQTAEQIAAEAAIWAQSLQISGCYNFMYGLLFSFLSPLSSSPLPSLLLSSASVVLIPYLPTCVLLALF